MYPLVTGLSLLLGVAKGIKITILLNYVIGLFGMYLLSRSLKISRLGSYFSAIVYMSSGMVAMQITEGHLTNYIGITFIPYVFLYFKKSLNRPVHTITASLFLIVLVASFSYEQFSYVILFLFIYSTMRLLFYKSNRCIKRFFTIILITVLLGAFNFIPTFKLIFDAPDQEVKELVLKGDAINIDMLYKMFFERGQTFRQYPRYFFGSNLWDWHEYGNYIGVLPFILFFIGIIFSKKYLFSFISAIFFAISLGNINYFNMWGILTKFPILSYFSVPTRAMILFLFLFCIVAGYGFDYILRLNRLKKEIKSSLMILIMLYVTIDLFTSNSPILNDAFSIPPLTIKQGDFQQSIDYLVLYNHQYIASKLLVNQFPEFNITGQLSGNKELNKEILNKDDFNTWFKENFPNESNINPYLNNHGYSMSYPKIIQNKGVVNCQIEYLYAELPTPKESKRYRGEVYLLNNKGNIREFVFSPNKLEIGVEVKSDDLLIINQKYAEGWKAKRSENMELMSEIRPYHNLISLKVYPTDDKITLYYTNIYFKYGIIVSLITSVIILLYLFKIDRNL